MHLETDMAAYPGMLVFRSVINASSRANIGKESNIPVYHQTYIVSYYTFLVSLQFCKVYNTIFCIYYKRNIEFPKHLVSQ